MTTTTASPVETILCQSKIVGAHYEYEGDNGGREARGYRNPTEGKRFTIQDVWTIDRRR